MNRWQKIARFNIIVISTSLLLTGSAVLILALKWGFPLAFAGFAFLGILGMMGLSQIIYKKDEQEKVEFDERDLLIQRKSALAGFTGSSLFFGLVCMVTWGIVGIKGSV